MKLLIVEDNPDVAAVTRELLIHLQLGLPPEQRRIHSIDVVADYESALVEMPTHDAVLCDGEFWMSTKDMRGQGLGRHWSMLAMRARRSFIPFCVYTGSEEVAADCHRCGVACLVKPCRAEVVYAVLVALADALPPLAGILGNRESGVGSRDGKAGTRDLGNSGLETTEELSVKSA